MKPEWKDAPKWARWLAMDANGTWCWFSYKPSLDFIDGCWVASGHKKSEWQNIHGIRNESPVKFGEAYDTLERRP